MHPVLRFLGALALSSLFCACSKKSAPPDGEAARDEPAGAATSISGAAPAAAPNPSRAAGPALRVAYSDWPGWVAWEVAIQKNWFREAGVEVDFKWFEYAPSMEAYSAGKVDAVCVTNGDALVTGANGAKGIAILVNDYSDGNDMIVAKPGVKSMAELAGKKVGVEVGFVDHLLLMYALKSANLTDKSVTLVNVPTDQTPQLLASGKVEAIAAWQPNSGLALKLAPGSTPIFTSANVPGLIYDQLVVNPKSLAERRGDWAKLVGVWDRVAKFVRNPETSDEAARIMAARVNLPAEEYKRLMKGTHIMDLAEAKKHWAKADGLDSVYGSSKIVDEFNLKNAVYEVSQKVDDYLDPSFSEAALK